jgi:tetratricopeptide (TPR) repeat protein
MTRQLERTIGGIALFCALGAALPPAVYPQSSVEGTENPRAERSVSGLVGLSLGVYPLAELAFGSSLNFSSLAAGGGLDIDYRFPFFPYLGVSAVAAYRYMPIAAEIGMSLYSVGGQLKGYLRLAPKLSGTVAAGAGYYHGGIFGAPESRSLDSFYLNGALGVQWLLAPRIAASLALEYLEGWNFYRGVGLHAGLSYGPGRTPARSNVKEPPEKRPTPLSDQEDGGNSDLELEDIGFSVVYPALFQCYESEPIGRAVLRNLRRKSIRDVTMSLLVEGCMDRPRPYLVADELAPADSVEVDFRAWFDRGALSAAPAADVPVTIVIGYVLEDERLELELTRSLRVESSDTLPREDMRTVGAFVTARDPVVLELARAVVAWIEGSRYQAADRNLLRAIALYEAISQYGIQLLPESETLPSEAGTSPQGGIHLQLPRETLESRLASGDDLAVLLSAVLEASGVETAFFIHQGRLMPAFALTGVSVDETAGYLADDRMILRDGKAWVPVAMADAGGFIEAQRAAAEGWRRQGTRDQFVFFRTRQAWSLYAPQAPEARSSSVQLPARERVIEAYDREIERLMSDTISARIAELKSADEAGGDARRLSNRIAVLYARYGLFEQAERQLEELLASGDYLPALLNLGHLEFFRRNLQAALNYYTRAQSIDPNDQLVMLSLARVKYELGDLPAVRQLYDKLEQMNGLLASRFSYLGWTDESGGPRRTRERARQLIIWSEG